MVIYNDEDLDLATRIAIKIVEETVKAFEDKNVQLAKFQKLISVFDKHNPYICLLLIDGAIKPIEIIHYTDMQLGNES